MPRGRQPARPKRTAETYQHPEAKSPMRPDVGTQAQFKKKKPPQTYRYDSSLSPALEWDGQNPARELGEALIRQVLEAESLEQAKAAAEQLRALGEPFLNWAGKAERLSFDVPTLPLFVHERLSTKAILETLTGHRREKQLDFMADLFGDPRHSVTDQVLRAYEYQDDWVNRLILGDSLVVMNSLLHYEGLGGQVQMIYMDPPYGVKFGSNFQPFVRKRDVTHGHDDDMTREPEMVQAYRDTWELGLHSYLTYLRDRLLLCRELLSRTGSIFVQISDDNLHHVRELMDEVFGADNFCVQIQFAKTTGLTSELLASISDTLLWYARDREAVKFRRLFREQDLVSAVQSEFKFLLAPDGTSRRVTPEEEKNPGRIPPDHRLFRTQTAVSPGVRANTTGAFTVAGTPYHSGADRNWKTTLDGMVRLAEKGRLDLSASPTRMYRQFLDDFPFVPHTNFWDDVRSEQHRHYVVQTQHKVVARCLLMTTDPGDLVLDPTCGSGTTACAAEQWGRRWITIDVSRVPLALARQRLLTSTFPWYGLRDDTRGPAGGFVYRRRKNNRGQEVGGIVPRLTLKAVAHDESPEEVILVDRPEAVNSTTRVTGPFTFEATIPTPVDWEADGEEDSGAGAAQAHEDFAARMVEVLRKSPVLRLDGKRTVTLKNVRQPARALVLAAEAAVANGKAAGDGKQGAETRVAFAFGPENGAVSEKLVFEAAREAFAKGYAHLYVLGFAIEAKARELVEKCREAVGIPATYVQGTPDLTMGDLLKNMRSSQIFSVCGLPEVAVRRPQDGAYRVELLGLDVFDPVTMQTEHRRGDDVPAWFLDTDYNDLCFHVCQAFFPRTAAWDSLKRALKGAYEEGVWQHLAGAVSAPFEAGSHRQIAVKVIDDRGNELLVVKQLDEAAG